MSGSCIVPFQGRLSCLKCHNSGCICEHGLFSLTQSSPIRTTVFTYRLACRFIQFTMTLLIVQRALADEQIQFKAMVPRLDHSLEQIKLPISEPTERPRIESPIIATDNAALRKLGVATGNLKEVFTQSRFGYFADVQQTKRAMEIVADIEDEADKIAGTVENAEDGTYLISVLQYACPQSTFTPKRHTDRRKFGKFAAPLTDIIASLNDLMQLDTVKKAPPEAAVLLHEAQINIIEARNIVTQQDPENSSGRENRQNSYAKNRTIDPKSLIPKTKEEYDTVKALWADELQTLQANYYVYPHCGTHFGSGGGPGESSSDRIWDLIEDTPFSPEHKRREKLKLSAPHQRKEMPAPKNGRSHEN